MAETRTAEERYIIGESEELSVGQDRSWAAHFFSLFPALQKKNYQLYFSGQLISLVGTWLQIVAEGWLVLQLTNSAFMVGLVTAAATIPTLLFSLFGGVIVDRFAKKRILLFTQASAMILALIYGLLTVFHLITVPQIMTLAFLLGVVKAVDSPARQAFVVELVGKKDLPSAIALNSGAFNGARVIGPGVAGFLIAIVGSGGAFLANAVSYIAVIVALVFIDVPAIIPKERPRPFDAIKAGIQYSYNHPIVKMLLIFAGVSSIFGWSYSTIMPVIAKDIFHVGATGLGYLYAASGVGALVATILVSALSHKVSPLRFILGGNTLFAGAIILFTFTSNFPLALFFFFLAGMGLLMQFSTMNSTIQHLISDDFRGRVMSIYTIMFLGLSPIGSLEVGFMSEHFGTDFAIRLGAIIVFLFGLLIFFKRRQVRQAFDRYQQQSIS